MDNRATYSDQDPDEKLAQQLGRELEISRGTEPLSTQGDQPFVEALLTYRGHARQDGSLEDDQSDRLWMRLQEAISAPTVVRLRSVRILSRWTAGVAAGLALAFGLYSWLGGDHEVLLASASTTVETITLDDGSLVTLRPNSSLFVIDEDAHRYRLEGEALFDVTYDPSREFMVETDHAIVAVLGTRFDVSTWANETQVFLERGKVRVDHASSSESTVLEPGQAVIIDRNMITRAVSEAAGSQYTDWLNDELSFDKTPSYRVAAELGHHYDVTLTLPPELENETLSGRILLTSLDQGLEDLSTVLGGRFESTGTDAFVLVVQ